MRSPRAAWRFAWRRGVVIAALASATPASAETPPWSVGVTAEQKAQAQASLDAGNALFLDKKYAEALDHYQAAVAAWDHPAIRFNIVRCLIQLDRTVDASDHLKRALAYGAAPLEDAVYQEALNYDKLLANQIAELVVACSQPGVKLTLDGQPLATCPGTETRRVAPGPHQVVGIKAGFLTRTLEVVAIGGRQQRIAVALDPLATAARIEHRWAGWVPWVVFGSGFAIGGIGAMLDLSAASMMDQYDAEVAAMCRSTACVDGDGRVDTALRDRAELRSHLAIGIMAVGGAAIATGAVMLVLNRGRTVYPDRVEPLVPTMTPLPGGAALTWGGRF